MALDDVAIIGHLEPPAVSLRAVDVEVVAPEVDHDRMKLAGAVARAKNGRGREGGQEHTFLELVQLAGARLELVEASQPALEVRVVEVLGGELLGDVALDRALEARIEGPH